MDDSIHRSNIHREKLESILANAVDAIITIDERGIVESANPATEKLFGYAESEVLGQNVSMLMPNPYREQHDGYLKNYAETGFRKIIGIGREVVGQRKNGSTFPMHLAVSEIQFDGKRLFTGVVRDISDLKEVEKKLAEVNEKLEDRVRERTEELRKAQADLVRSEKLATLGQVSGGIAHEIRNPLNAVKTSAYFLSHAKQLSPEKVQEHLERIDRQVTVIDNVITALSDVAKLPEAKLLPIDIEPLLRSVASSMSLRQNVRIAFEFEEGLPHCCVDANQIPIAFRNLIRNARDAMESGGTITIGAKAVGDFVEAYVADDGVGIDESTLPRILEPLYTTKARGMGLGLAITNAIINKNLCHLKIESTVGEGSRFIIQIPVAS